jgi:hypothetical protein
MPILSRKLVRFLAFGVAGIVPVAAAAKDSVTSRYPYDPACPWGRVANGKGMIVRCLSEQETTALMQGKVPLPAAAVETAKPANESAAPAEPKPAEETKPEVTPSNEGTVEISLGPVVADKGKLAGGKLGIDSAKERYLECLTKHGGLTADKGEVQVRFLVRERGRAEGVSVAKRSGVSTATATCIAGVVDRRYAGLPEAPLVGATVVIKFDKR